jgi:hypothetical protein
MTKFKGERFLVGKRGWSFGGTFCGTDVGKRLEVESQHEVHRCRLAKK